jgi:acetylornithine deacetylase/succinyl-diaminopimelate desuccinylase-like protein
MIDHAARVQAWLDERADEMAALLERLVACDTENPPGRGLGACAHVLRDAMENLGLGPEIISVPPSGALEDPCIVRGSVGDGARLIYFHGHFDVVPAQGKSQFTTRRRDGRISGRGTADMKGGIVSMLYGAAAARALGLIGDGRGRIVLHLVCDEETGSVAGSGYLRQAGLIDPQALAMVTAEPSGIGTVWHAARGALTLRVEVHGREAHVGQAHRGVNAFQHMVQVAAPLAALADALAARHTGFALDENDARGSMLVVGGLCGGGSNFNVVPGSTWFTIDGRYNPEEDLGAELERLTSAIKGTARDIGADVTVDVLQLQPSASTDATHPAAEALSRCITAVEAAPPRSVMCAGVLDIRWYAQLGIPAFAYGAGRLDVSHGPNEYIDEAEMRRCAAVYALYSGELLL